LNAFARGPAWVHSVVGTNMKHSRHELKPITFEGEPLPDWAQLLDLAASLCPVPEATRRWFSLFTQRTGADDARTVVEHCERLRAALQEYRDTVLASLTPGSGDSPPSTVHAAWLYALDTMVEQASGAQTCAWHVLGTEDADAPDLGDGDVTLRRI
jgi:hypothetical protein